MELLCPQSLEGKFYLEAKNTGSDPIELQVMDLTGRIVYERQPAISENLKLIYRSSRRECIFCALKQRKKIILKS